MQGGYCDVTLEQVFHIVISWRRCYTVSLTVMRYVDNGYLETVGGSFTSKVMTLTNENWEVAVVIVS